MRRSVSYEQDDTGLQALVKVIGNPLHAPCMTLGFSWMTFNGFDGDKCTEVEVMENCDHKMHYLDASHTTASKSSTVSSFSASSIIDSTNVEFGFSFSSPHLGVRNDDVEPKT